MSSIPPEVNRAISMTEIRESLKSNPTYLRVCIQSEVLEGLSCWESYKRFCRKFGEDAMDFPEFEFWFMRFYNGETDLEYDRSKEPKKKSLMDLPTELMTDIAKNYLNPFDMIMLSQVSRGLQFFCGTIRSRHKKIELHMSPSDTVVTFDNCTIRYFPLENGYKMECGDDRVTVGKGCYLDGVRDVLMAQFSSKNSTVFKWTVIVDSETIEEWKKLVGKLSFRSKISVTWVNFKADDPIHIFPLLALLTPGYLEWIEISNSPDFIVPYQRLAETEQWKQARRAIVSNRGPSIQELSQYFYHFEDFIITVDDLTIEFMIELSNIFSASPNFKHCFIMGDFSFTNEELASRIGGRKVDDSEVRYIKDDGYYLVYCRGPSGYTLSKFHYTPRIYYLLTGYQMPATKSF